MDFFCNENDWINANRNNYDYYYNNFPLAQNSLELPISPYYLRQFYINDMNERNLTPQEQWLDCYEALFSYLLSRLDGTVTFEGQTWLERTASNLPGAMNSTFSGIVNPFGVPITLWALAAVIIIFKK